MEEEKQIFFDYVEKFRKMKINEFELDKIRDRIVGYGSGIMTPMSNTIIENNDIKEFLIGNKEKKIKGELNNITLSRLPSIVQSRTFIKNSDYIYAMREGQVQNLLNAVEDLIAYCQRLLKEEKPVQENMPEEEEFEVTLMQHKENGFTYDDALKNFDENSGCEILTPQKRMEIIKRVYGS